MSKQFKQIKVGTIFSRPSIGTQVIYRKVSDETDKAPGKAEIIDDLPDHYPSRTGEVVTCNRSHVVHIHEENPITPEIRQRVATENAERASRPISRRRGNRTTITTSN